VGAYFCSTPFSKPLELEFIPSRGRIESAIRAALK
jgi:hypothetical protein